MKKKKSFDMSDLPRPSWRKDQPHAAQPSPATGETHDQNHRLKGERKQEGRSEPFAAFSTTRQSNGAGKNVLPWESLSPRLGYRRCTDCTPLKHTSSAMNSTSLKQEKTPTSFRGSFRITPPHLIAKLLLQIVSLGQQLCVPVLQFTDSPETPAK